jgi:hypothetical protein
MSTHYDTKNNTEMTTYRRNGRRRLGIPLKRMLDEVETGLARPDS